jgi:multidrug resistance efflux pump
MTRKQDEQNAPSGAERVTRRGLGVQSDPRSSTGEFPSWPQLPESPELPPSAAKGASGLRDTEEVTSSWQRSQSRGPEYHPPALPAAARSERPPPGRASSGTYRAGTPVARSLLAGLEPEALGADGAQRPSSPSLLPFERPVGRASALPALTRLRGRRLVWPILAGLVLGSTLALGLVRVPVRAWGVLETTGVPETLSAPLSGSVAKLRVATGDSVEPGDVIVELRSPELESTLAGRRSELERLRRELESSGREEKAVLSRNLLTLAHRRELFQQRLELKDAEFAQRQALLAGLTAQIGADPARAAELLEPSAAVQAAREARLGIVDALSQLDLEVSDRRSAGLTRDAARNARLADAEAQVLQAQAALDAANVRAPAAGWIESFAVSPGSYVQPGAELARLVPRSAPRAVVALLPSADASEVDVGQDASVQLVAPRRQEDSALTARVRYISREVAPAPRVQALLGQPAPGGFVQLELDLLDSAGYEALQLRSGARALVSLEAPQRRLGSVLLGALKQWWDFGLWG